MELAFGIATSSNNKIMFCIKPSSSDVSQVSTAAIAHADEEMKNEGMLGSSKGDKALKKLINNELVELSS